MNSCVINIEDDIQITYEKSNTISKLKPIKKMKSIVIIFLLAFHLCSTHAGIFSRKPTEQTLELEKYREEIVKKIMKEIKTNSNNLLQQDDSFLPSNITTHDVNALLGISAALSQGYEMVKKFFEKGAAPPNSVGNINATNVKMSQVQNKDNMVNNTMYNNYNYYNYYNNYTVHDPSTHVMTNKVSRSRKRKSLN